jgi:uncharacterized RDD family membrane protein YckC
LGRKTPQENMQIYIAKSGQQTGPFTVDQVQSMLGSGMVSLNDLAWHDGHTSWQPLHQIVNYTRSVSASSPIHSFSQSSNLAQDSIKIKLASFGIRLGAHIIDGIITYVLSFIVGFMIGAILGGSISIEITQGLAAIGGLVSSWLYYALMESSSKQATLGKMACGLYVTNLQGRRIGFGQASGRYYGMIISTLTLFIGFLMCAWTEKKQCLHDMMAGCLVLKK